MPDIPVNNPNEVNNYRNKAVWNHTAGALTFNNSTGREYVHIAHKSGSHLTFANQATSEFNPNNRQTLTNGDTFHTTKGHHSVMSQEAEHRVFGDFTIITGDNNLYTTPLMDGYMKEQNKLAAAKSSPEVLQPGYGNVTGAVHTSSGDKPDPKTGSTQGKNFKPNPTHEKMQELYKDTQKKLTPYERQMGNGGHIKLMSGKDIILHAGAGATNFDTVFINPVGREVKDRLKYDGEKTITTEKTSAPYFEEKDVASGIPFGNFHIQAGNKLDFNSAAGGITFGTSGPIRMSGLGITTIGGAQVNIMGGTGGGASGHVFISSGDLLELDAGNVNIKGGTDIIIEPGLSVIGNQIISGDLVIGGNLTVLGNIECKGTIHAVKDILTDANVFVKQNITAMGKIHAIKNITSDADIIASGISLLKHQHAEHGDTGGPTGKPIGNA